MWNQAEKIVFHFHKPTQEPTCAFKANILTGKYRLCHSHLNLILLNWTHNFRINFFFLFFKSFNLWTPIADAKEKR